MEANKNLKGSEKMKSAIITVNGQYNGRIDYDHYEKSGENCYDFFDEDNNYLMTIRTRDGIAIELPNEPTPPQPELEPLKGEVTGRSIDINNLIIGDRLDRNFIISLYWLRQALQKSNYDRLIILEGQFCENKTTIYDQPVKDDC